VAKYDLIEPFKRNTKNTKTLIDTLRKFISDSKDKDSIAKIMFESLDYLTEDQIFNDMVAALIGGAETAAHSLVSCLFFLQKYPHVHERLQLELRENGF
jgi:cytochrome P450